MPSDLDHIIGYHPVILSSLFFSPYTIIISGLYTKLNGSYSDGPKDNTAFNP